MHGVNNDVKLWMPNNKKLSIYGAQCRKFLDN